MASSNGPNSMGCGDGCDGWAGPWDGIRVRVHVQHAEFDPVGQVVGGRVDAHRARKMPRPDSMAGILAITSVMVWPRARRNRARQPHTSTTADMTCDPVSPTAWRCRASVELAFHAGPGRVGGGVPTMAPTGRSPPMPGLAGSGARTGRARLLRRSIRRPRASVATAYSALRRGWEAESCAERWPG